jgi:hypothetical protein
LVATNSIRGGANRAVLDAIVKTTRIFEAWSDEAWVNDGAAVRVSLVAFGAAEQEVLLDGKSASLIAADLSAAGQQDQLDLTKAVRLEANKSSAFNGIQKTGPFDIAGELARAWLAMPTNPNARHNADVLSPYRNGIDVTRRSRDVWIIDFGWTMAVGEAALFEAPFQYALSTIKPIRDANSLEALRRDW